MRELKFRVWSESDKEYRRDCKLRYLFTSSTGLPSIVYNDEGDRFDIEQYTGLKDKNGKEIYEGDIVDKKYDNLAIFDRNGVVGMGYLDDSDGYNNGTIYGWKAGDCSLADVCDACEVIGNIHENPELLGGEE